MSADKEDGRPEEGALASASAPRPLERLGMAAAVVAATLVVAWRSA